MRVFVTKKLVHMGCGTSGQRLSMSVQLQLCPDIMSEHLKKIIRRTVHPAGACLFVVSGSAFRRELLT